MAESLEVISRLKKEIKFLLLCLIMYILFEKV